MRVHSLVLEPDHGFAEDRCVIEKLIEVVFELFKFYMFSVHYLTERSIKMITYVLKCESSYLIDRSIFRLV